MNVSMSNPLGEYGYKEQSKFTGLVSQKTEIEWPAKNSASTTVDSSVIGFYKEFNNYAEPLYSPSTFHGDLIGTASGTTSGNTEDSGATD